MTRSKIVWLFIVVLLVAAGGSYPVYADLLRDNSVISEDFSVDIPSISGPSGNPIIELATSDLPSYYTLMVYRVQNPVVTTDYVREIGRKLGFEGSAGYIDQGTKIAMLDEGDEEVWQLSVWVDSGAIEYAIVYPDMLYPLDPPSLPKDDEAKQIATDFLAQAGLLPDVTELGNSYEIEVVSGGTCGVGIKGTSEVVEEYVTHLLVRFTRLIDGIPVSGPGMKLGARIGDNGQVINILKVWREVEPYKEVAIKTSTQAYQDLRSGKGSYHTELECEKVIIDQVNLVYWMDSLDESQEYIVPVYEFKGRCLDKNGEYIEDFVGHCEAL